MSCSNFASTITLTRNIDSKSRFLAQPSQVVQKIKKKQSRIVAFEDPKFYEDLVLD